MSPRGSAPDLGAEDANSQLQDTTGDSRAEVLDRIVGFDVILEVST